jgi:hypothetical protein
MATMLAAVDLEIGRETGVSFSSAKCVRERS